MVTRTKIPLRNIWLLFLYAADLVQFRDRFEREVEAARDLPDLLGRLLAQVAEERVRRNLSRGYQVRTAVLSRVRGRIDMLATESEEYMKRGQVVCRFEEYSMDTPRNRLVRAALEHLAARVDDDETGHRCRSLAASFSRMQVAGTRPSRTELATDQIGRNETADKLMVALATMVFDCIIPSEEDGGTFVPEENATVHLVRKLFERAIGNALRLELEPKGWRIYQGRRLSWPIQRSSDGIASIMPSMQTDIELNHPQSGRRIVIDTKYTDIHTSSRYRESIISNGHLYQLYSYLRTQEHKADPSSFCAEGMLLHPLIGLSVNETTHIQGHDIHFKTIDLTTDSVDFEQSIKSIPQGIAPATATANSRGGARL